ncbi:MAG: FaeA/PapI family transcriptional regulator, partial [Candidatus Micrarchaeota archaeon]
SLASKKTKTLSASYGEGLEEANASWLAQKRVAVDVRGISYSVGFGEELKLLKSWNVHGVKDDEEREYKTRVGVIAGAFEKWKGLMFRTKELEELENALGELHAYQKSEDSFVDKHSNLERRVSKEQEQFESEVIPMLKEPCNLDELARMFNTSKSNIRKHLQLMEAEGKIKRTVRRGRVGRPRVIYYLSQEI